MFSVASNFDDELVQRLAGLPVDELFGAIDSSPLGHGRPRALTVPARWRDLARHVARCRAAGMGFNLLLNPVCLEGREGSRWLARRVRRTLRRAMDLGVTAVTVAHPWLVELARETPLRVRISVFVGISTEEQARYWEGLGAHVLALDTHVLCRDLRAIAHIRQSLRSARIELPVNIGCLLRCPLARTHAARLSHSSRAGAQPLDQCAQWCLGERRQNPVNLIRADFIRPEDLDRYAALGVDRFKIVDRHCSTDVLVQRVRAYHERHYDGDLLELLGPRGSPPRRRRLPAWDAAWHLGLLHAWQARREAPHLMDTSIPWVVDNAALDGLIRGQGCAATGCEACGHCRAVADRAVRPREA